MNTETLLFPAFPHRMIQRYLWLLPFFTFPLNIYHLRIFPHDASSEFSILSDISTSSCILLGTSDSVLVKPKPLLGVLLSRLATALTSSVCNSSIVGNCILLWGLLFLCSEEEADDRRGRILNIIKYIYLCPPLKNKRRSCSDETGKRTSL